MQLFNPEKRNDIMKQLNLHTNRTDLAQNGGSEFDIETTIKIANEKMDTYKDTYKGNGLRRQSERQ